MLGLTLRLKIKPNHNNDMKKILSIDGGGIRGIIAACFLEKVEEIYKQRNPDFKFSDHFDLIGGILLAGDGTKLRAQNSKKNNYNQKKIDRHLAYIDSKLE